jgi:hypothetical protein
VERLGRKLVNGTVEAFGLLSDLPQNGPSLRQETLEYGSIPAASFLALNHFASDLDGAIYEFTP